MSDRDLSADSVGQRTAEIERDHESIPTCSPPTRNTLWARYLELVGSTYAHTQRGGFPTPDLP